MTCERIRGENGETIGFVCGPRRRRAAPCYVCGEPSAVLCDRILDAKKTCDRPCCGKHSRHAGKDFDLCAEHAAEHFRPLPKLRVRSGNRFTYRGPGRLDVTLSAGAGIARTFAPPKPLLDAALAERERARELLKLADRFSPMDRPALLESERFKAEELRGEAWAIEDAAWSVYAPAFRACMRVAAGLKKERSEVKWGALEDQAVALGVEPRPDAFRAVLAGQLASPDEDGVLVTVFCCFCGKPFRHHCHSRLICELFAAFPGVEDAGEAE